MALLFMDGFEANDMALKWSSITGMAGTNASTRFGVGTCTSGGAGSWLQKSIPAAATVIIGFAYIPAAWSATSFLRLKGDTNTTLHLQLCQDAAGHLVLQRNATTIATGTVVLPIGAWHYIELSATINDTTGTCVVRVDGVTDISFTGDTKNAGTNTTIDSVTIWVPASLSWFDDLYICDGTGSTNKAFLGDVRVQTLMPTGAGASTQLTPSVGNNYDNVNDIPYVSTTYNSSSTAGDRDTYALADLIAGTASVFAVQDVILASKSDSASASIKAAIKSGGTVYYDATQLLGASIAASCAVREVDPATSAAWTLANVNALEFGAEVV
jgi:hypothetical protein